MTSQPEKLFNEKLQNFQKPASPAVWERIEANLDKKKNKSLWMKIAAAILLMAVAGFMLWPGASSENTQPLTRIEKTTPQEKQGEKNITKEINPSHVTEQNDQAVQPKNNIRTNEKTVPVVKPEHEQKIDPDFVIEPSQQTEVAVIEPASVEPVKSKTIVYTADEVNARFLKKKVTPDATAEEKKSSGIQKLMGLAQDLKNNDNGLGDLRQKKDEILALSFLNKEDKTEKRKN